MNRVTRQPAARRRRARSAIRSATARRRRRPGAIGLVLALTAGLLTAGALGAQDFLPEPTLIYVGTVPAGSEVALRRGADTLARHTAQSPNPYVLRVSIVQPLGTPGAPPAGKAFVGDRVTISVNDVAQGQVTLADRGTIYRLDFPAPERTPSPAAVLSPIRILFGTPLPDACGPVTCTPDLATRTPTRTATGPPTHTPTIASPGPTATVTATHTPTVPACVGDCGGDGEVTVDDLIRMVAVAIGSAALSECPQGDGNGDRQVSVDDIIMAVNNAASRCPVP